MDVAKRFGENLRAARRTAGLSQEALAFTAGLHRTVTGLIERGERTPSIDRRSSPAPSAPSPGELMKGIAWEPAVLVGGAFTSSEGLLECAAVLRARQPGEADAASIVREGRGGAGAEGRPRSLRGRGRR